jgi:pimeloyl-ACP methyl ester carboxylesterase
MPILTATDDTQLYYDDWGTGRPVVFVHGWSLCNASWDHQLPVFARQGLRCVAPDRRGHGRSSRPATGYDFDTLADDLAAVLDRLDLREVTFVAHSMGAGEVVRYLSRHGAGRVARIALLAPITPYLSKSHDNPHAVDPAQFEMLAAALGNDRAAWFAASAPGFFGVGHPDRDVSTALVDWGLRMILDTPLKIQLDTLHTHTSTDFRPDLAAVDVPTLVIHGDIDQSAPIDLTGRPTAAQIAGARLEVYAGAPHGLMFTHQQRLHRDLLAFMADA